MKWADGWNYWWLDTTGTGLHVSPPQVCIVAHWHVVESMFSMARRLIVFSSLTFGSVLLQPRIHQLCNFEVVLLHEEHVAVSVDTLLS